MTMGKESPHRIITQHMGRWFSTLPHNKVENKLEAQAMRDLTFDRELSALRASADVVVDQITTV